MTTIVLAKTIFFIPFLCIELFENLFVEILPRNIKRKYYSRAWGNRKIQDVFWIMYFDMFTSSAIRRVQIMSDKERGAYFQNLEDDD